MRRATDHPRAPRRAAARRVDGGRASAAPDVWATVNVCDTAMRPTRSASAARWPGCRAARGCSCASASSSRTARARGRRVKSSRLTDSGWVRVAVGRGGEHDAGWSFEFKPPPVRRRARAARRGLVRVAQGQARGRRSRARSPRPGHPGTVGAEPADYSAATCEIA